MPLYRICSIRFSDSHPGVRIFIAHRVEVYPIAKPKEPVPVHYVVIIEILIDVFVLLEKTNMNYENQVYKVQEAMVL